MLSLTETVLCNYYLNNVVQCYVHCSSQQLPRDLIFIMTDEFGKFPSYLELDKFSIPKIAIAISLSTPLEELEIEYKEA